MIIYILSCETTENKGGIYAFELAGNGALQKREYFPCDRPMYAVKSGKRLCVLLRQPFENNNFSGYFYVDEKLKNATQIKSTRGIVACHLCVDDDDVYTVNYLSGNIVKNGEVSSRRIGRSVHPVRQTEAHTHFVGKTPDGYLAVCDLGTDTLACYNQDLTLISAEKVPDGYGIRHLVFSKDGKYIYAVNELVPSVSVFAYNKGTAILIDTVSIKCKHEKANGAAIRLSNDGKYLYISLREENVICVFAVEKGNITLTQTIDCGGDNPRDFNIFGEYLLCTNEKSNTVTVMRVQDNKFVERVGELSLNAPLCVL
ncbi:MAG: beta-propeller fold lactonase family protein [Clostridia bacterium]|nr:beta-propeller fold lactonase family protein [Clostridia bacterium]